MFNVCRVEFLAPGPRIACSRAWHTSRNFYLRQSIRDPKVRIHLPWHLMEAASKGLEFQRRYAWSPNHLPENERPRKRRRDRLLESAALIGLAAGLGALDNTPAQ